MPATFLHQDVMLESRVVICQVRSMPAAARRIRRLPGLPSSNICLESMTGQLDEFAMESYLGSPAEREVAGVDLHSQMEVQLGMKMKPVTRGIQ